MGISKISGSEDSRQSTDGDRLGGDVDLHSSGDLHHHSSNIYGTDSRNFSFVSHNSHDFSMANQDSQDSSMANQDSRDFSMANQDSRDFPMANQDSQDFSMANQDSQKSTQNSTGTPSSASALVAVARSIANGVRKNQLFDIHSLNQYMFTSSITPRCESATASV